MEQNEAVRIFDLVVKEHMLPATLDKLVPMSFMGAAAVKFYQAKVKLMDQLGASEEQRKATLADGQDAGEMLLNIEARIGELSYQVPTKHRSPSGVSKSEAMGRHPDSINKAQAIHRNPEAVAAIIKEARENEDIPAKTAVLNKIRADKAQASADRYKKEVEEKNGPNEVALRGEALSYLCDLRRVVTMLPHNVPKEGWNDTAFAEAKALVSIIRGRLEDWE